MAIDAYRAYGDPTSLQAAQILWNVANRYVIQPEDASLGSHPTKTAPIAKTCSGGQSVQFYCDVYEVILNVFAATTAGGVLDVRFTHHC